MNNTKGVQCINLRKINKNITNASIIGIIIRSQDAKYFFAKNDQTERGVWNFTLRDSIIDYINVTCWGSKDYISNIVKKFVVGNIVNVTCPKVSVREIDDKNEKYRPSVTSPFNLTLNEENSTIIIHEEGNYEFLPLLHYPTKPAASFLTLADIYNNGSTFRGDYIDLLVAVKHVSPLKKFKSKNDGREIQKRDISVLDQTHVGLKITFWEEEFIQRASQWKPRDTILFLADVRVDWSTFERCMVAVPNSKTIITEDPLIPQAEILREFSKNVPINPNEILNVESNYPDPDSISSIMTCKRVLDLALKPTTKQSAETSTVINNQKQFTALLFAFVSFLDLDGYNPVVIKKCEKCYETIRTGMNTCMNLECPIGSGSERGNPEYVFKIPVTLSDHTGSLSKCRLNGKFAEKMLGVTANEFILMSDDDKARLKWIYLLERCDVRILVDKREKNYPIITIISCKLANIQEVAAKLPVY